MTSDPLVRGRATAVCSGACACLTSLMAKAAGERWLEGWWWMGQVACSIFFVLAAGASNALMWTLFVDASQRLASTSETLVFSTSANIILTALVGFFLLGEQLSWRWMVGAGFIVYGMTAISSDAEAAKESSG